MRSRILHVIDHTGSGGAQIVVGYLLRALRERYTFGVAVLGAAGHFSEDYAALGVSVTQLGSERSRWNPLSIVDLASLIRRERYDLVHTHLFKSNIIGTMAARWTGRAAITHDHTGVYPVSMRYYLRNPLILHGYLAAYRRMLDSCARVIVLTPEMAQAYARCYPSAARKVVALPNAVDTAERSAAAPADLRAALGVAVDTPLIAMVGRLDPEKGWRTFLDVAARVQRQSPCAFLVIGSGSEERALRAYAQNMSRVFFLGYRRDVPALLSQVDVFLLTSRREPFGIVLLEAMLAGSAVVATRSGGPQSIITDNVTGLLADVDDVSALAAHVLHLLRDHQLRGRLADAARQVVHECYSVEAIAARMGTLYDDVLAS